MIQREVLVNLQMLGSNTFGGTEVGSRALEALTIDAPAAAVLPVLLGVNQESLALTILAIVQVTLNWSPSLAGEQGWAQQSQLA